MRSLVISSSLALALAACGSPEPAADPAPDTPAETPAVTEDSAAEPQTPEVSLGFYELSTRTLEGEPVDLSQYAGGVALVVNVASKCGYTPQYADLQRLHEEMAPLGVNVLAFPSNDFGGQEPGSAEQIRAFCTETYGVTFPVFEKVGTRAGGDQSPIYAYLGEQTGELPNWNFCKYLVGRDGTPIAFFKSSVEPDSAELRAAIQQAL